MKRIRTYIFAMLLCLSGGATFAAQSAAENAIEQTEHNINITARAGGVEIDNNSDTPVEVAVFAITGTLVKQLSADSGERVCIELPSGYYIVKAGNTSKRIAVK